MEITAALKNHFGHDSFRDGQRQVIETLLAGRSALAIFPTGGGKLSSSHRGTSEHLPSAPRPIATPATPATRTSGEPGSP